jgi:endoglucanase
VTRPPRRAAALVLAAALLSLLAAGLALGVSAFTPRPSASALGASASAPGAPTAAASAGGVPIFFRFDQVGYPRYSPKRALIMTSRPLRRRRFELLDVAGHPVLTGLATGPVRWNAHELVYTLDFTRLRAPGRYTLRLNGSRSPALRIAPNGGVYRPLTANALAFFQNQRDGFEVLPGPLHRAPSHLRDASALVYVQPRYRGPTLLGSLTPTGARIDASGGWFDAGDYLKFVQTASFSDLTLLFALRAYPAGLANRAGLEAQVRFGTNWLLKMYNPTSRVLYYQVGIGNGNDRTILGDHDLWRLPQADDRRNPAPGSPTYFETHRPVFAAGAPGAPISPNLAGRLAAAFALCSQVFAASDPAYAHRCLLAGQAVYDQANTNPRGALLTTSPHSYYNETEWRDDMELGATELYLATQQAIGNGTGGDLAHTNLIDYLGPATHWANAYIEAPASGQDSLNLYDVSTLAHYDLIGILKDPRAALLLASPSIEAPTDVPSLLKDRLDQLRLGQRLARQEPFGLADPSTNLDTVAHALGYAIEARMYDQLTHTSIFAAFAQQQLDWVLGANAFGSSFVVGAGSLYPHCLAAQISNLAGTLSGRGAIMLGATVEGPTAPSELRGLELPEGARRCSAGRFAALTGHRLGYLDDVRSPATSEPTDDLAALTLLAAAQQAAGG